MTEARIGAEKYIDGFLPEYLTLIGGLFHNIDNPTPICRK